MHRRIAIRLLILCGLIAPHTALSAQHPKPTMSAADASALHAALDAYDAGRFDAAEPALRSLSKKYPYNYEASEALGSLYVENGNAERAIPLLQRAVKLSPQDALGLANLGAAYLKLSRWSEALNELQRAIALDPSNAATQTNLGKARLALGQRRPAIEAFRTASSLAPENASINYYLAFALDRDGSTKEAADVLDTLPESLMTGEMQTLAAETDERCGRFAAALEHYQAAARLDPSDGTLYALTAELLRHWNWEEAIQVAQYGASRYPSSTHFPLAVGVAYFGKNDFAAATAAFSRMLEADPDNAVLADLLGRSCAALPDSEAPACEGVYDFVQRHPGNAVMMTYAANSILHEPLAKRDLDKAFALLLEAIATAPQYVEAYLRLGILDQVLLKWKESADALEHAIALRPTMAEAHYRLSRAYAHLGRRDDAQKEIALHQRYSKEAKDALDARLQEVMRFVLNPN